MSLQSFVNLASNAEVVTGMRKIRSDYLPNGNLLDSGNPLGINAVNAIFDHFKPSPSTFTQDDANTYLAASSFVHCKDGWQYLSDAVDCIFKGDFKTAIHLSYYAELRAGMSFLASEGIGIFDHVHFCINSVGIKQDPKSHYEASGKFKGWGTHGFIWECLRAYALSPHKSVSHLAQTFWHNGISFDNWITHIPGANSVTVISEIIKDWILDWSFDIGHFQDDREGRNNASYRPSKFQDFSVFDCRESIEAYSSALKLLEPISVNRFSLLDKYLFKMLFLKIHNEITAIGSTVSVLKLLEQMFANAGKPIDASLKSIFQSSNDHLIVAASKDTLQDSSGEIKPFTILSRALLLLRICNGSVANLLKQAGISKNDLDFFINYCCIEHGFLQSGKILADCEELWDDIFDAMTDIDAWTASQNAPIDLKSFNDAQSKNLMSYKQINRVNYWGIAI